MGKLACFVIGLALCAGCSSPQMFPLQPGEQILFQDAARAEGFRRASGNDSYSLGGKAVTITRPTLVQCQ